ncbi:MAG: YihA family ribosome biogenesis GTP-binding protein [Pseudomonadales bacterium]|nr:YihA family ribosome biogenesis GTP-binding protein [Pseudomonadales bacterium]
MSRFPKAHFMISAASAAQFPPDEGAEVAFAGRSNAGKSSAINALTERKALARTSKAPGQTRLLNFFEIAPMQRIVDLPGYGYASVAATERRLWVALIDSLRARQSLVGLFLIVDVRRGIGTRDAQLIDWAREDDKRVHVLLSKADKSTRLERTVALKTARNLLGEEASVQLLSVTDKTGVTDAQNLLVDWLAPRQ